MVMRVHYINHRLSKTSGRASVRNATVHNIICKSDDSDLERIIPSMFAGRPTDGAAVPLIKTRCVRKPNNVNR